jgi:hypothetical protein
MGKREIRRDRRFAIALSLVCVCLLFSATAASATPGAAFSITPSSFYTVGVAAPVQIVVANTSNGPTDYSNVQTIDLYPGCSSTSQTCPGGLDPGAFTTSPTATGTDTGVIGTNQHFSCAGTWSVDELSAVPGHFKLAPPNGMDMTLLSGSSCTIDFTATASRLPTFDVDPVAGAQTYFSANTAMTFILQSDVKRPYSVSQATVLPGAADKTTGAGPTGQRAAALAKCKKKHSKKARKRCRRKASQLPL